MDKKRLKFFLLADLMMNTGSFRYSFIDLMRGFLIPNTISFLRSLRYCEYYAESKSIPAIFYRFLLRKYSIKFGYHIYPNTVGYGLVLPHYGTIIIGSNNHIGNFALLNVCTCITEGNSKIGDALFLGTGAVLSGHLFVGKNVSVGSNSVLMEDCINDNVLIVGIPAKVKKTMLPWYESLWPKWKERVQEVEKLKKTFNI